MGGYADHCLRQHDDPPPSLFPGVLDSLTKREEWNPEYWRCIGLPESDPITLRVNSNGSDPGKTNGPKDTDEPPAEVSGPDAEIT